MTPSVYQFPAELNLAFLCQIYHDISTIKKAKTILFDWQNVVKIETEAMVFYLSLQAWCTTNKINIEHISESNSSYQRLQNIISIDYMDNTLQDIYVSPARDEAEMVTKREKIKQFLKQSMQIGKRKLETEVIEILFYELFMNICQHSRDTNGFIFIPAVTEDGVFEMLASDLGVGIVYNIRNYFTEKSFENDARVIEYASQDWITSKTTDKNQGRGLNIIKTSVEALKGELRILCGHGCVKWGIEEQLFSDTTALVHRGTFLHIILNINQLSEIEEADYSDNFDF
jgi:anti-sigma regulatory factor (Ser/Thr protein kinase)